MNNSKNKIDMEDLQMLTACAADMICVLRYADETNEIPPAVRGNALWGIENYISMMCDRIDAQISGTDILKEGGVRV